MFNTKYFYDPYEYVESATNFVAGRELLLQC